MKIGFIGFGEVAYILSNGLLKNGAEVFACVHERSNRTKEIAEKCGVNLCETYKALAEESDILISAVVPSSSVEVAIIVGEDFNGTYVDMNSISPETVKEALGHIKNGKVVDAAIIGSVRKEGLNVNIIASGPSASDLKELEKYGMNIQIIGQETGQASAIKLLRSAYTKGVSAILFETLYHAYKLGIDKDVLDYISKTEGNNFKDTSISRVISAAYHAERRSQEMAEVVKMLIEEEDPMMAIATEEFYRSLNKRFSKPKIRPVTYKEVFKLISE